MVNVGDPCLLYSRGVSGPGRHISTDPSTLDILAVVLFRNLENWAAATCFGALILQDCISPCFFDGSGPIRCLASDASENSTSDAPEIGKSGFSDFRKSGFSEIRKSGNLKIRIFGFPEIRIFGNRISEIPENPKILISGIRIFGIFGKSGNPKIQ